MQVKYNTIPEFSGLADMYQFAVQDTGIRIHFGSVNNCGVGLIENVTFGYSVASYGVLPPTVAKKYKSDWGEVSAETRRIVNEHVRKMNDGRPLEEMRVILDKFVAEAKRHRYNCYIMTDAANRHTKYRMSTPNAHYTTADLGEALAEHKIGYVVRSPISISHAHKVKTDMSLTRVYIWYPERAPVFKQGKYLGAGAPIPASPEEGYKKYFEDVKNHEQWPVSGWTTADLPEVKEAITGPWKRQAKRAKAPAARG